MLQYVAILSPSFASCQPAPNVTVRKFKHAHFSRSQSVPVLKTEATAAMCLKDMDLIHLTHINWDCEGAKLSRGTAWNWAVVLPSNPLSAIKRAEAVLLSLLRTWHFWTLRSFCFVRRFDKPVCVSKQTNKHWPSFWPLSLSFCGARGRRQLPRLTSSTRSSAELPQSFCDASCCFCGVISSALLGGSWGVFTQNINLPWCGHF